MTTKPLVAALRAEADAHELLAAAKRAQADALESEDERVAIEVVAAEFGIKARVLVDAEGRGEIAIERAGRKRFVRRSEVDRWAATRRRTVAKVSDDGAGDDDAARARTIERLSRRSA